ncbi:hypothetical protein M011DRAFT_459626 [Sporormia fimetaria CBS 119925]|uniref:Uncharacterized protein n=1 Tax=Sporormia fimetaria CBS 119925 TaxID=1340428 RepID=A0A6A6V896_9PLEO|nr:hypothetical protein M011DRAFT_459626 [Sporormia fimetaria CBS 119925]
MTLVLTRHEVERSSLPSGSFTPRPQHRRPAQVYAEHVSATETDSNNNINLLAPQLCTTHSSHQQLLSKRTLQRRPKVERYCILDENGNLSESVTRGGYLLAGAAAAKQALLMAKAKLGELPSKQGPWLLEYYENYRGAQPDSKQIIMPSGIKPVRSDPEDDGGSLPVLTDAQKPVVMTGKWEFLTGSAKEQRELSGRNWPEGERGGPSVSTITGGDSVHTVDSTDIPVSLHYAQISAVTGGSLSVEGQAGPGASEARDVGEIETATAKKFKTCIAPDEDADDFPDDRVHSKFLTRYPQNKDHRNYKPTQPPTSKEWAKIVAARDAEEVRTVSQPEEDDEEEPAGLAQPAISAMSAKAAGKQPRRIATEEPVPSQGSDDGEDSEWRNMVNWGGGQAGPITEESQRDSPGTDAILTFKDPSRQRLSRSRLPKSLRPSPRTTTGRG